MSLSIRSEAARGDARSLGLRTSLPAAAAVLGDAAVTAALFALVGDRGVGPIVSLDVLGRHLDVSTAMVLGALIAPLAILVAGGYERDPGLRRAPARAMVQLVIASTFCVWIASVVGAAVGDDLPAGRLAVPWLLLPVAWGAARWALEAPRAAATERVLLLGGGRVARRVVELAQRYPERGLEIVGYADDGTADDGSGAGVPFLGSIDALPLILEEHGIDRVILTFSRRRDEETLAVLRECEGLGVQLDVVSRLYELVGVEPRSYSLGGLAIVEASRRRFTPTRRLAKRALDVVGAIALLVLALPLVLVIAAAILLDDGRPVFYRQERAGRNGRTFRMWKFRSMRTGSHALDRSIVEEVSRRGGGISETVRALKASSGRDPRVTRVGVFLRRTSLDELPQLLNVVRGDMSLVGPRPLPLVEAAGLHGWQHERHVLRPGMTGLWQVLGRAEIDWDERMELDVSYVRHQSFVGDLRILLSTVPVVLRRRGAR